MTAAISMRQRIRRVIFFFPVQLVFLHIKANHLLLFFWLLLFGYITHGMGGKFGIPYLFLYPEYLGGVDVRSHIIMGFALGGFIMAFNIYSYVMHSSKFPFIATLAKPFLKFCINNFIIPMLFVIVYMVSAINFQLEKEFMSGGEVAANMFGILAGLFVFFVLSLFYFFRTNKDIFKLGGKKKAKAKEGKEKAVANVLHKPQKWYNIKTEKGWLVVTYLSHPFKVALARESSHYDNDLLQKVFLQNHINASFYEVVMLTSFLVLGSFREVEVLQIPAGASIMLLFTMILMMVSACYSWFKGWTFTILIVALVLMNYGSKHYDWLRMENHAYGLNYGTERADYSTESLVALRDNEQNYEDDRAHMLATLNKWREKNLPAEEGGKPKLVVINSSGGGLRSSLWTVHVMQYVDSATNNEFLRHTSLITGSSGGMIGAAYMRELYWRQVQGDSMDLYDPVYKEDVSSDILNPVAMSVATNDLFIRYQWFTEGAYRYTKDRAYAFETQLNENLYHRLDKRVMDYYEPVRDAEIPMMILAPTVVNDGRRILISSQPISYMTNNRPSENVISDPNVEEIEFMRFFKNQDAENLAFESALRMNATFPYILPSVTLPCQPSIEVMDAGLRDNFGMKATLQYLNTFSEWIRANTSGIVIVQIRDQPKDFSSEDGGVMSMFESLHLRLAVCMGT